MKRVTRNPQGKQKHDRNGINCRLKVSNSEFQGEGEEGELKHEKKRGSRESSSWKERKNERLPCDPLSHLVSLSVVAPGLHLDGEQLSSKVSSKEASDRLDMVGKEHPPERGPQLQVCC